ncbi:DUF2149 domain-containing protein [Jatrophihabitans sp. YIM 134969]
MKVSRRARRYNDASGDPLDGLVNLFDVGIVLAVGFLLAALASQGLTGVLSSDAQSGRPQNTITLQPGDVVRTAPPTPQLTAGQGTPVGQVYRLDDGQLIYVLPSGIATSVAPEPTATPTPTG